MAMFINTQRGPINVEHVTNVTPPAVITRGEDGPLGPAPREIEVRVYFTDGHTVTLKGQHAQDMYDYFVYICAGIGAEGGDGMTIHIDTDGWVRVKNSAGELVAGAHVTAHNSADAIAADYQTVYPGAVVVDHQERDDE